VTSVAKAQEMTALQTRKRKVVSDETAFFFEATKINFTDQKRKIENEKNVIGSQSSIGKDTDKK
jgi:hypothetical protein